MLHNAESLAIYSSASQGFQIRQQDVRRLQREAAGRKTSREPPTEVPGTEDDSSALSQGSGRGPRAPRGQERHTWHLVDLGGSKEKFKGWAGPSLGLLAGLPGGATHVLS